MLEALPPLPKPPLVIQSAAPAAPAGGVGALSLTPTPRK
jgi:hypothetical protein